MSIYADIKFNMKDGYPEPILYQSQCGEFRDVAMELSKLYNRKHGREGWSQSITLSGEELEEFGKFYAQEIAYEPIEFLIENDEHNWCDSKKVHSLSKIPKLEAITAKMLKDSCRYTTYIKIGHTKALSTMTLTSKLTYQSSNVTFKWPSKEKCSSVFKFQKSNPSRFHCF